MIGLGKQAREDHLPGLLGSEFAELVAVCDVDAETVREIQYEQRVHGYTNFRELFESEDLDFVIVAVPHFAGRDVIECALERGVHVLKEKPFATSLAEAYGLVRLCEDAGVELMVTLQRRFNPIYTTFCQLYDQIGRPFVIDAEYTIYTEDPASGWRGEVSLAGGGCIIDMGYHMIDMLLWYFGLPDRVLADFSAAARPDLYYDAEDTASILFGYDSGLFGTVLLSRCIAPKTERIRVVGSRGMVCLERGRIQRLRGDGTVIESLSREQAWPAAATNQIDYFCRVICGERPNLSGPRDHLVHAGFIHACYTSRQTGGFVKPKEFLTA